MVAIATALFMLFWWLFFASNTHFTNRTQSVYIPTGTDFNSLKSIVKPYLKNSTTFEWAARAKRYHLNPKAGHYVLAQGMGNQKLINTLRARNTEIEVVFNNQQTLAELAGRVAQQIEADSISLLDAFNVEDFLKQQELKSDQAQIGRAHV